MELQDTIGVEEAVLVVVVDPQELPRTWASVDLLGEQIGEGTYRAMPEDVPLGQSVTMDEDWGVQLKAWRSKLPEVMSKAGLPAQAAEVVVREWSGMTAIATCGDLVSTSFDYNVGGGQGRRARPDRRPEGG